MKMRLFKRSVVLYFTLIVVLVGLVSFTQNNDKYFEIAKNIDIFTTLFKELNRSYVDEISPNIIMKKAIDSMLESLDPYTNFIPEDDIEDYRTMTTGQYGGIGSLIARRNNKNIILMPYENYPAHKAGLKIGDEIISIDGKDVRDKNTVEISKLLKGQAGTKIKIVVNRYGKKEPLTFELVREKIKIENIPYVGMVTQDIGYFHLTDFTQNASKEVRDAIVKLKEQGAKKIIFDLRDNPGGLLNEAIAIANLFIPKGKEVVSTKGKMAEWNKVYYAENMPLDTEIPIVVLTSERSASAAEIVSGVIQDYDRGILVGQKTFGKGLVQATRPLSFNAQLKVTTAKYYIPSGRCIQAIDYSKKKEDGSGTRTADSLRVAFTTKGGRIVYDGAGIYPDVQVERDEQAQITQSLVNKNLIFDYATEYAFKKDKIAPAKEFALTDKEYDDFVNWLANKDYDYKTKVESNLETLIESAKKEQYYEGIKDQIYSLRDKISHNKEQDLQKFKSEIIELLENEIVSRYYLQKGLKEASFDHDKDILTAIDILNNPERYAKLLEPTKTDPAIQNVKKNK